MTQAATASTLSLLDILTIIGFIVSVIGGALGAFSIVVTWNLYRVGNNVNIETLKLLGDVKASSHTTEVTSGRHMEQLVDAVVGLAQQGLTANVGLSRTQVVEKLKATLKKHAVDEAVQTEVLAEVTASFRGLEHQASATVARLSERGGSEAEAPIRSKADLITPAAARIIRWLDANSKKFKFFGVRYLRETVFASDPAAQEALQYAIDLGMIELYKQPNPRNPSFPTTACRLNRAHPLTQQILGASTA